MAPNFFFTQNHSQQTGRCRAGAVLAEKSERKKLDIHLFILWNCHSDIGKMMTEFKNIELATLVFK